MARKRHVHKYHHLALKFRKVWACALPTCSHFMPSDLNELVIGRASICWNCDKEFILDEENMKKDKPICSDCDETKTKIGNLLSSLGVD